jgi:2-polyprenyl-3-methyl-5-hydroxy-6-metoxy-1,4-benzoquinol methylase
MRILVAIANHGTKNDQYARQLIDEYRGMSHDVDVVILTNIEKNWGDDIEVRVGLPTKDPWSLPFGHRQIFAERLEHYDLFIYTEDDTLLTERNIAAFVRVTKILGEDEVTGFMRSEQAEGGSTFLSTVHSFYHWDPASVKTVADHTFAYFSNEHAACYILTREQLRRSIVSGGYVVPPHEGRYDLLVTAATDPYTQCGFRKLICISHIDEFILDHLPSAYLGQLGLGRNEFELQLQALLSISRGERPTDEFLIPETKIWHSAWSKNYYEPADDGICNAVSSDVKSVLSVGCGWGATEAKLAESGRRVVGAALDSVVAACAEHRGIECVYGSTESIAQDLENEQFDALIISNVLHLIGDPVQLLRVFLRFLKPGGEVIVLTPNFGYIPILLRRLGRKRGHRGLGDFDRLGFHVTSATSVKRWFAAAGLRMTDANGTVNPRFDRFDRLSLGLLKKLWIRDLVVTGRLG